MAAIEHAVSLGRQAIVLVPEISLTPQTTRRFLGRFSRVAVLHSGMTEEERCSQWTSIAEGDVDVVIGPRSAVFAPTRNLGVIVVDEEHDGSYKQDSAPRYNARDVALVRAKMLGIPVVLGSATPALESYKNALSGRYSLLELPDRVNSKPMPEVHVVDMAEGASDGSDVPILSSQLSDAVEAALERGEQAILMLNRRGFHTIVLCGSCRSTVQCNHCDSPLVYHHDVKRLDCHKCGSTKPVMRRCGACGGGLFYAGIGTQKLEEAVKARFPSAVVARMDSDSTKERGSHEKILEAVRNRHIDILIGTQMIAKGLDFHNVTVVGVVNADVGLSAPDFRAEERAFQLIAQVAGRTGRGEKDGAVYVQTLQPENRAIQYASKHDYVGFAKEVLGDRSLLGDPPYSRMMRIIARGVDRDSVAAGMLTLAELLASKSPADVMIFGPASCPITRIGGEHRMHIIVKANAVSTIRSLLHNVTLRYMPPRGVDIATDVDPVNML
jgi:primosomal protein N' (replication factor Y)